MNGDITPWFDHIICSPTAGVLPPKPEKEASIFEDPEGPFTPQTLPPDLRDLSVPLENFKKILQLAKQVFSDVPPSNWTIHTVGYRQGPRDIILTIGLLNNHTLSLTIRTTATQANIINHTPGVPLMKRVKNQMTLQTGSETDFQGWFYLARSLYP